MNVLDGVQVREAFFDSIVFLFCFVLFCFKFVVDENSVCG